MRQRYVTYLELRGRRAMRARGVAALTRPRQEDHFAGLYWRAQLEHTRVAAYRECHVFYA